MIIVFTRNGHTADGSGAPFSISAGYDEASKNLFEGVVDNVIYDSVEGSRHYRRGYRYRRCCYRRFRDFGLPKRFRVAQETAQQARDALGQGDHRGERFLSCFTGTATPKPGERNLAYLTNRNKEPEKRIYEQMARLIIETLRCRVGGVETEGSALDLPNPQTFPQLEIKSPYRWEYFTYPVAEILRKFGINNSQLTFYPVDVGEHFAPVSRPYYDLLGNTGAEFDITGTWGGFVTDWQRVGNEIYFLYSIHNTDVENKSRILKYDLSSHEWSFVHSFAQGDALWNIAVTDDANNIFVMTRDNRNAVSDLDYDSLVSRANSTVKIQKISFAADGRKTVSVIANNGSPFRPQMAHYYHIAGGVYGMLPDNRGGFTIARDRLFYRYTKGEDKFGIAGMNLSSGAVVSIFETTSDGEQNHSGCAFSIRGDTLFASFTWRDGVDSTMATYSFDLSTL